MPFLHELPDAIVEKDYWIMHCLWGLQQKEFQFELKGGTSLSKGFNIIERFSEDIDIQIHPHPSLNVKIKKNHDKPAHVESRKNFFNAVAAKLNIREIKFYRDHNFDDHKRMRNAGIRGEYQSLFSVLPALKPGIILELGFDQTMPNILCDISSWVLDKAFSLNINNVIDNRAKQVKCYCPEYTFIEKLQTISTKFRIQQEQQTVPINFLRHYYDIYQLLKQKRVLDFIGTPKYYEHKAKRFRSADEIDINKNEAFLLSNKSVRSLYTKEFEKKSAIYFSDQPSFESILEHITKFKNRL